MRYLIDSNVIISFLDNEPPFHHLLESLARTERFISVITYMEVQHGVIKRGPGALG